VTKLNREKNTFISTATDSTAVWAADLIGVNGMDVFLGACVSSDGTIYASTLDLNGGINGSVYAFTSSGERLWWRHSLPSPTALSLSSNGHLYLGGLSSGSFRCLNSSSGDDIWAFTPTNSHMEPYPEGLLVAPLFSPDGRTVYFFTAGVGLYALALNGTLKWFCDTTIPYTVAAPAVMADGDLVFASVNGAIWSVSAADGTTLWTALSSDMVEVSFTKPPCIGDNGEIYVAGEFTFYSVDKRGSFLWKYEASTSGLSSKSAVAPIFHNGVVYFSVLEWPDCYSSLHMYAFDSQGRALWDHSIEFQLSDVTDDGHYESDFVNFAIDRKTNILYISSATDDCLYAFNASDNGTFLSKTKVYGPAAYRTAPAFGADRSVIVGGYKFLMKLPDRSLTIVYE
jgi:outer membrane protein assembly factor BamB